MAIDLSQAIELRVKGIGQVVADGSRAGDCDRGLSERSAVEIQKAFPGGVAAQGARVGKSEFGEPQRPEERGLLHRVGMSARRKTMIKLCADCGESSAELVERKAAALSFRSNPKLPSKARRK